MVFPGDGGVFQGWGRAKDRLDAASGVDGWVLHDLRRTVATGLQRLGVRLETTEAILNHVSAAALAAWGARLEAIVEGREAGSNVVAMRA